MQRNRNPRTSHPTTDDFRRAFLRSSAGLGSIALASLLNPEAYVGRAAAADGASGGSNASGRVGGLPDCPHFAPKAKRVIYLFQSGAPSQMDLFDWKPKLADLRGTELPDSIRKGQRLTGMTSRQESFPVAPSKFQFAQHGKCGAWVSELMPHVAKQVDEISFVKTLHTEAINHDPAVTFFQTGNQLAGRPSMGSWVSYGLGSDNADLPAFVAMVSVGSGNPNDQPLYDRLWGSGFLPSKFQGIKFRSVGDPVLYLSNPDGLDQATRRRMLDDLKALNELKLEEYRDPEIATRIAQYEMAFRMQTSVPDLVDISKEPKHIQELYGDSTQGRQLLVTRRLIERGVRFVQVWSGAGQPWDNHNDIEKTHRSLASTWDPAIAAFLADLKQRGLFDSTLVLWGGEFGRTPVAEFPALNGRDHTSNTLSPRAATGPCARPTSRPAPPR